MIRKGNFPGVSLEENYFSRKYGMARKEWKELDGI
jgi:hypothetical protein